LGRDAEWPTIVVFPDPVVEITMETKRIINYSKIIRIHRVLSVGPLFSK
jgi:hypothetical protein